MIFTTGPLAPRGAYNDSSNRRLACSTVGIPALRFSTINFVCEGAATTSILRAATLVWGGPPVRPSRANLGSLPAAEVGLVSGHAFRHAECALKRMRL